MNTGKLYLNFDNLFNGDKFLCEQSNALLNRRSEDVFRELKKRIEASFTAEITEQVNRAFSIFPYSSYFLAEGEAKSAGSETQAEETVAEVEEEKKLVSEKKLPEQKEEEDKKEKTEDTDKEEKKTEA